MKRITLIILTTSLLLVSCGGKDKVKYDPYGKGHKGKNSTKEVVEKRQKGFDIPFTSKDGVRFVMVTMNGVAGVKAIFDTGCSIMSISELELASLVKNGTINDEDIGKTQIILADGTVLERSKVRMNVTLIDTNGNEHNAIVEAVVQENLTAEAMIGNAIFSQMGSVITIDDNKGIIHFE